MAELSLLALQSINQCVQGLQSGAPLDLIIVRVQSLLLALEEDPEATSLPWIQIGLQTLYSVDTVLSVSLQNNVQNVGRPRLSLPIENIKTLLHLGFKLVDVAKIYGVSNMTIRRRLQEIGSSVRMFYSEISDQDLNNKLVTILTRFPNTGYKRMKGFLRLEGVRIPDRRLLLAMRITDPIGAYWRRLTNRAIVRRQYNVQYFEEIWHLDTNMKLIRWNIVIRACIDGKTRTVVYLSASGENSARSNLMSFVTAVNTYGIPCRTRSDMGGENVLIAQFMLEHRGVNRGSHICGRSVHNQRIERYWRDVYYGYTSDIASAFTILEQNGILKIDDGRHIELLHRIFLPRINNALEHFRQAWNNHPISTESNRTPIQLMLLHSPPPDWDMQLGQAELEQFEFLCNNVDDTNLLLDDTIINPAECVGFLSAEELSRLGDMNLCNESDCFGYDVFEQALTCLVAT